MGQDISLPRINALARLSMKEPAGDEEMVGDKLEVRQDGPTDDVSDVWGPDNDGSIWCRVGVDARVIRAVRRYVYKTYHHLLYSEQALKRLQAIRSIKQRLESMSVYGDGYEPYSIPGQHHFDGINFNPIAKREVLERITDGGFEMRDDDVMIASYPKTGSTWLQYVLHLLRHQDEINATGELGKNTSITCPFLEATPPHLGRACLDILEEQPQGSRRLMKTHLYHRHLSKCLHGTKAKVLVMMRNPKDTLVSYYHFYRMNEKLGLFKGSWDEFFEMFRHSNLIYGDWFDFTLDWWNKRGDNITCLRYEDVKTDAEAVIRKVAQFIEVEVSDDQISSIAKMTSFDQMKNNPSANHSAVKIFKKEISPFFRKGDVGDWKNYFSEEQNKIFESIYTYRMAGSDLDYTYGVYESSE